MNQVEDQNSLDKQRQGDRNRRGARRTNLFVYKDGEGENLARLQSRRDEESDHEGAGWDVAKMEAKEERFGIALDDR